MKTSLILIATMVCLILPSLAADGNELYDILGNGRKEWRLAFRGSAYINKSVFDAYANSAKSPANVEPGCKQLDSAQPCSHHYRSPVLDNWVNIEEVAFAMYERGQLKKHIIFDGKGSTSMNWLSQARIKDTDWTDVKKAHPNFFSVSGDPTLKRRFFMNNNYGGCPSDAGWFVAIDRVNAPCTWELDEVFPVFKYAKGTSMVNWTNGDFGRADVIAVFVKFSSDVVVG